MLYYGMTEEEYAELEYEKEWEFNSEDDEIYISKSFDTNAGWVEAGIGCEDGGESDTWEVSLSGDGIEEEYMAFEVKGVLNGVAKIEKIIDRLNG